HHVKGYRRVPYGHRIRIDPIGGGYRHAGRRSGAPGDHRRDGPRDPVLSSQTCVHSPTGVLTSSIPTLPDEVRVREMGTKKSPPDTQQKLDERGVIISPAAS